MLIEETKFRDKPILVIKDDKGRRFFSAGVTKCKIIIENIESIKTFIDKYKDENRLS